MPLATVLPFLRNRVLGLIVGTGFGMAAADVLTPKLRPLQYRFEREATNRVLSLGELASGVVRNAIGYERAVGEAANTGYDQERFDRVLALTGRPPGVGEVLDLRRRNVMSEAEAREALGESDMKAHYGAMLLALERVLLSPQSAAGAVASNALGMDEGAAIAGLSGMTRADFEALAVSQESGPGSAEVLAMLNRGEIGEGEAGAALRRNGLEPRYVAPLLELRNVLPPVTDLIRFMVREVFDPGVRSRFGLDADFPGAVVPLGRRIGLTEQVLRDYWAAHWELPSTEQGYEMFHRDVIDQATLELLLRTKDVMPFWRSRLIEVAYRVPGRIDLRRMFRAGVISEARVRRGYLDLGYHPDVAAELTRFAVAEKQAPERELAKGEITGLYEARLLDRPGARSRLQALGYSETEADAILALADFRARNRLRTAAIAVVRSRFLAREIDREVAAARLDRLGMPPAGRDEYLELWTFERAESPTLLTEAQARAALTRQIIGEPAYRAHLARLGYEPEAIGVLVQLAAPRAAPARQRDLTRADILRDYREGRVTRPQAAAELGNQGYDAAEVGRLLAREDAAKAEGGP